MSGTDERRARTPWDSPALVVAVMLALEAAHLAWEATHGGVLRHHLLDRSDLPAISNLWGLLVVPCLSIFAVWRWRLRRARWRGIGLGLLAGFGAGTALSLAFRLGAEELTSLIFFASVTIALLLPGYRVECLLGFVMGMCWTFGAVLPLLIGGVVVAASAALHLVVYRGVRTLWRRYRRRSP